MHDRSFVTCFVATSLRGRGGAKHTRSTRAQPAPHYPVNRAKANVGVNKGLSATQCRPNTPCIISRRRIQSKLSTSKARNRVNVVLLRSVYCPSHLLIAQAASQGAQKYQRSRVATLRRLVLHLIIRVDEVIILILVVLAFKLLVGLGEVDRLAACTAALDDVRCFDLFHVVFVGLLSCVR